MNTYQKLIKNKNELLSVYLQYSLVMEELLTTVFEIQTELKEILKEQSSMISKQSKKSSKSKPKKK